METKHNLIAWTLEFIGTIHYFEDIRLHNELNNSALKELCKEDLKGIRNDTITRPYNIQDEIVLGAIYESDERELLNLFEKKFEKAKNNNGFKTKEAFAKYEYKYQKGIWKNHDITKWIPIAKQWLNLLKGIKAAEPGEAAQVEQNEKRIEINEENIFCKSMPLDIPKEHFKRLTSNTSKNGKPFLTETQLNNFIQRAFLGKTDLPKEKINSVPKGEKLLIQSIFYEFYNNNCFDYFGTTQKQEIFIKLLTDNFQGWEYENVKSNFNPKTNKRLL
ncbi:hypothetical protein [Algibacter lectus]|uniref:hypothetical protein n=1 Tax=Algibacter lectus TaxID=221126 RepID=UPI00094393A2|nr:hypothetical protein [Algibacter lectus]